MEGNSGSFRFQTLEFRAIPWNRWASGLGLNAGIVLALLAIPAAVDHTARVRTRVSQVSLIAPPPIFPPPSVKRIQQRQTILPKIRPPAALPPPPRPAPLPKPVAVASIEAPKIGLPAPPSIARSLLPLNRAALVSPDVPAKRVETGAFDKSSGMPAKPASARAPAAAKTGLFDSPGASQGERDAGGAAKLVARAGFGGIPEGSPSGAAGTRQPVRAAGFGEYAPAVASPPPAPSAAPAETPVEITFKPKPAYTPAAREKKIEGEVLLEVLFSSTGEVRVLRTVHGLGFGLDENARAAALRIRFHPATRNGRPVDVTGIVHILFEMS